MTRNYFCDNFFKHMAEIDRKTPEEAFEEAFKEIGLNIIRSPLKPMDPEDQAALDMYFKKIKEWTEESAHVKIDIFAK